MLPTTPRSASTGELNEQFKPTTKLQSPAALPSILADNINQLKTSPFSIPPPPKRLSTTNSSISSSTEIPQTYSSSSLNLLKRPSHQRSQSQTSLKKSPGKRISGIPGDRKTLVDQFYSINESRIKKEEFQALDFIAIDKDIQTDPDLTNYLLNIDTIIKDLGIENELDDEFQTKKLSPFLETLELVNVTLNKHDHQIEPQEINKLDELTVRLNDMNQSVLKLRELLDEHCNKITGKYRPQVNENVTRLNDLLHTLESLENRLTKIRLTTNNCKDMVSNDFLNTIELLEIIDARLYQYSKGTGKQRLKQLNITLAIIVIISSIYLYTKLVYV